MSRRVPALSLATLVLLLGSPALAAPAFEKPSLGPVPTESTLSREQALTELSEGEAMLQSETSVAEGLGKMLDAYIALEAIDGTEASGVRELRSWLVKALEALGLPDEAATLRARGSIVDHPLSVMPSTWFDAQQNPGADMSLEEAEQAFERGLTLLTEGDIDGLSIVFAAYEAVERELGAESDDAKLVRSFLVGLLEAGGFVDEATILRARGSVTPATEEETQIYAATWLKIIEAESSVDSVFGANAIVKGETPQTPPPEQASQDSPPPVETNDDDNGGDDDDDRAPVVEKGSVIPSFGLDVGVGTFQPDYGEKGLIWIAGLELHWTLFTAKIFAMQLGGAGRFGRNRDKRWLADTHAELRFNFSLGRFWIRPEFGVGYDQLAGGSETTIAEAFHVAPAAYYHFGGGLGVRLGKRFGMYAHAVRLNRDSTPEGNQTRMRNETRVRAGFMLSTSDEVDVDVAFVFSDYDALGDDPGARIFAGAVGLRI